MFNDLSDNQLKFVKRYLPLFAACIDNINKGKIVKIMCCYKPEKVTITTPNINCNIFEIIFIESKEQLEKFELSEFYLNKYLLFNEDKKTKISYKNLELEYFIPSILQENFILLKIFMNNKEFIIKP